MIDILVYSSVAVVGLVVVGTVLGGISYAIGFFRKKKPGPVVIFETAYDIRSGVEYSICGMAYTLDRFDLKNSIHDGPEVVLTFRRADFDADIKFE